MLPPTSSMDVSGADGKLAESPILLSIEIIPKTHNNCTLALCFDGTGDKFDSGVRKLTLGTSAYHHLPYYPTVTESEHSSVHIAAKEGQQAQTDGIPSGTFTGSPVRRDTDILYGRLVLVHTTKNDPGFFTPIVKKVSK